MKNIIVILSILLLVVVACASTQKDINPTPNTVITEENRITISPSLIFGVYDSVSYNVIKKDTHAVSLFYKTYSIMSAYTYAAVKDSFPFRVYLGSGLNSYIDVYDADGTSKMYRYFTGTKNDDLAKPRPQAQDAIFVGLFCGGDGFVYGILYMNAKDTGYPARMEDVEVLKFGDNPCL